MRSLLLFIAIVCFINVRAQNAKKLHAKAVVADGHNDVLTETILEGIDISNRIKQGHSDLVRWKEGGLDVQFFSVWTGERARNSEGFYKDAVQEIDSLNVLVLRNPTRMVLARNFQDVKKG